MRRRHDISEKELETLRKVQLLGEARDIEDFVYVLGMLRAALKK